MEKLMGCTKLQTTSNKKGNPIKKKCETNIIKLLSHSKCGTGKVWLNEQILCTLLLAGGVDRNYTAMHTHV
jgi:hypothetical protein